jgi:hypothetical protein
MGIDCMKKEDINKEKALINLEKENIFSRDEVTGREIKINLLNRKKVNDLDLFNYLNEEC